MIKFLIVVLFATAISCGHLSSFRSGLTVQHLDSPNLQVSQIPVIQPLQRTIPSSLASPLVTDFQTISLPQTVPQYLVSLPRTQEFVIPQNVPLELLSITAPQAIAQSSIQRLSAGSFQTLPLRSQLVSPAQKARTQPLISTPIEAPVVRSPEESVASPAAPQTSAENLDSNSFDSLRTNNESVNTGFSTPTKPLNFAPNLPEVNNLSKTTEQRISQSAETPKVEQTREPIVQQKVEQLREPVQQRIESIPQSLKNPSVGLNSY